VNKLDGVLVTALPLKKRVGDLHPKLHLITREGGLNGGDVEATVEEPNLHGRGEQANDGLASGFFHDLS
jgi:hypothetical protein